MRLDHSERQQLRRWLERLAEGDRQAFTPAFACLQPLLEGFCARLLPCREDAEDAAQAALLKVFARATEYDATREALPWVLGIAAWECRTVRKARMRRREAPEEEQVEVVDGAEGPEARLLAEDLRRALAEVMGGLRPEDVETLEAAMGERERPAIPGATFRKRLERALGRLREAWRMRHGVE
ncbi:sigma-70 family RNA polymerase sigma factor [Archangium violaceum]|uniref:RNA polymerase sigma factor n=1 Tax=Archangium violaceum TaxID=83451 RepID=UPI001951A7A4|nr:sigma factor [Archangium violaceum]QRN94573.1 sigma-70 family RNA polymerase sigma factor [Archangium violaceum]